MGEKTAPEKNGGGGSKEGNARMRGGRQKSKRGTEKGQESDYTAE